MENNTNTQSHHDSAHDHHTPFGIKLFGIYLAFYGVFVLLSAFKADLMGRPVLGGLNLAIMYGFFLIVSAVVLSLIYLYYAGRMSKKDHQ